MAQKFFNGIIISILFFLSFDIQAQTKEGTQNIFRIIGGDIETATIDGFHLLISPLHFSGKDLAITGGTIFTTAGIMTADKDIRKYAKKNHSDINDKISDVGKAYGNVIAPVIIGGSIYSYGLFFKDEDVRTTGRMLIEAAVFSGAITTVIKTVAGRSRPFKEEGNYFYRPIQFNNDHTSFPSGHSTLAFAVSTVLSERLHNVYSSIGLYTLAGVTALSRVYTDDHWASDVFMGSAIGFFVGRYIADNSGPLYKDKSVTINLSPTLSGFNLSASF